MSKEAENFFQLLFPLIFKLEPNRMNPMTISAYTVVILYTQNIQNIKGNDIYQVFN